MGKIKRENIFIVLVFTAVIAVFSCINLYELLADREPDGRKKGLERLELVQDTAINLWGALQKGMGKRQAFGSTVYEDVTLLDNGMATMADVYGDYTVGTRAAEEAYEFSKEIGSRFLYVAAPDKVENAADLPSGVIDRAGEKFDGLTSALMQDGIPLIDMREVLREDGDDWYSYFYASDHHWRNGAAFLAAREITAYMNEAGLTDAALPEASDYEKRNYEDVFLGTHGRMAGKYYTGLDDYELWLPLYDTAYTLEVPSAGICKEGSFEECFVNYQNLEHYSFDYYAYYAYLDRDYERIRIRNLLNPDGPVVVIVRDSTAVPVSVFLAQECSEIDLIDLRYLGAEASAKEWIKEAQPDLLIYMFGPGYMSVESATRLR